MFLAFKQILFIPKHVVNSNSTMLCMVNSTYSLLIMVSMPTAGLDPSYDESIQDESEQLLPRPILVIKGTTPTTVTLEWEWTLLPEQIAGSDIVYSVLILGSKFHSNINSSFW